MQSATIQKRTWTIFSSTVNQLRFSGLKSFKKNPILNQQDFLQLNDNNWPFYWQKHRATTVWATLTWETFSPYCLWQIWCTRNANTFNQKRDQISYDEMIGKAMELLALQPPLSTLPVHGVDTSKTHVKWTKAPRGTYKLNFTGLHDAPWPRRDMWSN